jgi:monothiol glutaredoxin
MNVPEIDVTQAKTILEAKSAVFVDVRQPADFAAGHVPGAEWFGETKIAEFTASADKARETIVYCYKGRSSLGVTEFLLTSGFSNVKSMSGGFEAWDGPTESSPAPEVAASDGESHTTRGLTLSAGALTKLTEYLTNEPAGTAVRVTVEGGRFGLALDDAVEGDTQFDVGGVSVVIDPKLDSAIDGLSIDWVRTGMSYGFKLEGGTPPAAPGRGDLLDDVKQRIAENKIMIFMKGTANQPMCGFSARSVEVLSKLGQPFGHKNVLETPDYRYVLSEHSNWPTIPQVFIDGEFVGGCDILMELNSSGELQKKVDSVFSA